MNDSNWNDLQQSLINGVVDISKSVRAAAAKDIVAKLNKMGMPSNKLQVSDNKRSIVAKVATETEYQAGKTYFDAVMQAIDADKDWAENL